MTPNAPFNPDALDETVTGPAPGHAVARPRVVLGSAPRSTGELERVLRRRLIVVALLAAFAALFFSIFRLALPEQSAFVRQSPTGRALVLFEPVLATVALLGAGFLNRRRDASLALLRRFELVLVGTFGFYVGWSQLVVWDGGHFAASLGPDNNFFVIRQAVDSMSGRWFALIVGIATLVPETRRRSVLLITILATTALALTAWMAWSDPVYRPHALRMMVLFVFWIAIACTTAVFGSFKLTELREQVREAMELGQYRLRDKLGAGGMGEVYLAEHVMLKQACAIKLIKPERAGDPAALKRFEREVQAMSRLKHWNTVRIFDYGHTDDGTFYYVMEYLPGWTLDDLVRTHGALPPARAVHFVRQVCQALREAHAIGLIHRDIKPANIIACERGGMNDVAKLLDFGLVRDEGAAARDATLTRDAPVGTPAYMSPEQAVGSQLVDARSDIYSLGAVAFYLLTGEAPFAGSSALHIMMSHVRDEPRRPSHVHPGVPAALDEIVMRCLAKEPVSRYPDAAALEQDLARCGDLGQWSENDASIWWGRHARPARNLA